LNHVDATANADENQGAIAMTDHKKKGDFDKARKNDVGGNKKQDNSDNSPSQTGNQNAGHGGHR
jgi:hypothetical protein